LWVTKPEKHRLELSTRSSPRRYTRGSRVDHNLSARDVREANLHCIRFDNDLSSLRVNLLKGHCLGIRSTRESPLRYPGVMAESGWVEQRAAELLEAQGLSPQWSFGWDRAKTRFGQCDHHHRRISLSRYLATAGSLEEVDQVLLHEVAHALAGSRAGHGPRWRSIAQSLGYTGGRTHSAALDRSHARWIGVCPSGHEIARYRRPGKPVSCAACDRRFNSNHLIAWSESVHYSASVTSFQKQT